MARTKQTVYKSTGEWIPSRPIHGGKAPRQQMITAGASFPTGGKAPRQQMITECGKKTVKPESLTRWQEFPNKASKGPPLQMGKEHGCEDNHILLITNMWQAICAKYTSTAEAEAAATEPNRDKDPAPGRPLRLRRHSSKLDPNVWDLK